jgi:hypothetical protein
LLALRAQDKTMYALYTTVENVPGTLETKLHGTYARQEDAEQIGRSLRLLYSWVKNVEVRWEEPVLSGAPAPKKTASSARKMGPGRRRRSS